MQAEMLDPDEVEMWQKLVMDGSADWPSVMMQASSDDVRLAILDEASSMRVRLKQYVDDMKIKVASRAQLAWTLQLVLAAARQARAVLALG